MIVLDTNVVSELMKPPALRNAIVFRWTAGQDARNFWVASMTYAEILAGIEVMPQGKRRLELLKQAVLVIEGDLAGRVLPFDAAAAKIFARLSAERRRAGRRSSRPDLMIASTALSHGFVVATRDAGGFDHPGLTVIDPWDQPAP